MGLKTFEESQHLRSFPPCSCLSSETSSRWTTSPWTTAIPRATSSVSLTTRTSSWWSRRAEVSREKSRDRSISFHGNCTWPWSLTFLFTTLRPERLEIKRTGQDTCILKSKQWTLPSEYCCWFCLYVLFFYPIHSFTVSFVLKISLLCHKFQLAIN